MIYTVFKVCQHETRQLLLVQDKTSDEFSICVYDEHNDATIMRLNQPTVANFKLAIKALEDGNT